MELLFLGTGSGVPAKQRNVSGIALKLLAELNEVWLFDCGEGTQMQILKTPLKPRKIKKIFITHLHGDHIFGLPGLLSSRSFMAGDEAPCDLEIYAPFGLKEFVLGSLHLSQTKLNYRIHFHEIEDEGLLLENEKFRVWTKKLSHGIPCFGFRVEEKDHIGELQVQKLQELGVKPGPIYAKIKNGETVTLEDGRMLDGKEFIGTAKKGRIVTILGDTRKCGNAVLLGKDSTVLVHESTYEEGQERKARKHFHSSVKEAAEVAIEANAKQLLLTHFSARFLSKDIKRIESQGRNLFPNTKAMHDLEEMAIHFDEQ